MKILHLFQLRVNFAKNLNFTKFHEIIMRDLLLLSTSHYDGVRILAQNELFDFFSHFPNSHRLILPDILRHLNKAQNSNDEQLEGSLFLITDVYGTKKFSLLTNSDWISMSQLWPALVNSKPSEKQTIVDLLKHILYQVQSRFFTLTLSLNIPDICVDYAKKIWTENKSLPKPAFECPSDQKISEALEKAETRNQMNLNSYNEIVENLVLLIEDQKMYK
jgi:proteasome activator subunit 4